MGFEGIVEGWCSDGTDAIATFLTVFYNGESESTVLFETACEEDTGVTFGCDVDAAGEPVACGVCAEEAGHWVCAAEGT